MEENDDKSNPLREQVASQLTNLASWSRKSIQLK